MHSCCIFFHSSKPDSCMCVYTHGCVPAFIEYVDSFSVLLCLNVMTCNSCQKGDIWRWCWRPCYDSGTWICIVTFPYSFTSSNKPPETHSRGLELVWVHGSVKSLTFFPQKMRKNNYEWGIVFFWSGSNGWRSLIAMNFSQLLLRSPRQCDPCLLQPCL